MVSDISVHFLFCVHHLILLHLREDWGFEKGHNALCIFSHDGILTGIDSGVHHLVLQRMLIAIASQRLIGILVIACQHAEQHDEHQLQETEEQAMAGSDQSGGFHRGAM